MRRKRFVPTWANGAATNISTLQSLGPSNDNDPNVQIEILAAELGQNPLVWAQWHNCDERIDVDLARLGVGNFLGLGALRFGAGYQMTFQNDIDRRDFWAGWLALEIAWCGEELPDEWPWDPSRPVAGQYEEWASRPPLTAAETADVIAQSSNSYEPRTTEWEVDGPVRDTADATEAERNDPKLCAALATLPEVDPPAGWEQRVVDAFAEEDTASKEPWTTAAETKDSDATCCARPK